MGPVMEMAEGNGLTGREDRVGLGKSLSKGGSKATLWVKRVRSSLFENANPALCLSVGVGVTEITKMTRDPMKGQQWRRGSQKKEQVVGTLLGGKVGGERPERRKLSTWVPCGFRFLFKTEKFTHLGWGRNSGGFGN